MSRSQRDKGARWEREVAALFAAAMPGAEVKRGLQARGGSEVADVACPLYHVECKVGALPNPRAALAQALRDCPQGKTAVAVIKDDRRTPFVVLRLEDFLDIVRENWEKGNK